jgi:hypothetical protein
MFSSGISKALAANFAGSVLLGAFEEGFLSMMI